MKQKSIIIGCYAFLILIGGIIGYIIANSLISLFVSGAFALLLFLCVVFIWKDYINAYYIATALIFFLFAFFSYRFLLTYKLAPSGILALISGGLFVYLIATRKRTANILH